MTLNLDPAFQPFPNQHSLSFEAFTFSGGEPHIKIQPEVRHGGEVSITQRIKSFADLGLILMAVDALKRMGVEKINLVLPYFPGGRQDRIMVPGEPLSVKVYADLINRAGFNEILLFDPHSSVTPALLDRCLVINNERFIKRVKEDLAMPFQLIAPDAGAVKKAYELAKVLNQPEIVICSKQRDVATGKIKEFQVFADDLQGKNGLIVDDICDGGNTFIGLAKVLKEKGAGKLFLAVSHGIFSQGLDRLKQYFTKIYTTDSFQSLPKDPQLVQLNISQFL